MQDYLENKLLLDENELVSMLIHGDCGGLIDWSYLCDKEKTAELIGKLSPNGKNSISTVLEIKLKKQPICRCDYDFPETID